MLKANEILYRGVSALPYTAASWGKIPINQQQVILLLQ